MIGISDAKYKLTGMNRLPIPFSRVHLSISAIRSTLITSCPTRIDSTDWIDFLKRYRQSSADIRENIDFYASTKVALWPSINVVGNDDGNSEGSPYTRVSSTKESSCTLNQRFALVSRRAQLNNKFFTYSITYK